MNSEKKNNQSARSIPGKSLGCVGIRHVRILHLIFGKGILQCIGQLFLKMIRFIFKFFDTFLKLFDLVIGKIHGERKRIDPVTKLVSFRQNALRLFAMKKYAEFLEGAIRISYPIPVKILCLQPTHAALQ